MTKDIKLSKLLFIIYMLILCWIILFKFNFSLENIGQMRNINLVPFGESMIVNGKVSVDEITNNVIVFIPVGVYLSMINNEWGFKQKTIFIFLISLSFEVLQYIIGIGASDITDLITNTTGGAVGIIGFSIVNKIMKEKTLTLLNRVALMCTGMIVIFIGLLIGVNI